jgi:hypothetical protein
VYNLPTVWDPAFATRGCTLSRDRVAIVAEARKNYSHNRLTIFSCTRDAPRDLREGNQAVFGDHR